MSNSNIPAHESTQREDSSSSPCSFSVEQGLELLRISGARLTSQRIAMLELFAHHSSHLTAQQVFEFLTENEPTLSRATVYNNLDLFEKFDILARYQSDNGDVYYDANTHPHHHMICTGCGTLHDVLIPQAAMDALLNSSVLCSPDGAHASTSLSAASIWFKGVCQGCQ